jgi:hypothetical protein
MGGTVVLTAITGGSNQYARDDHLGSCFGGSTGGHDLVYSFTTATSVHFLAQLRGFLYPGIFLRGGSCTGSGSVGIACNKNTSSGAAQTSIDGVLAPGAYFLFVDGTSPGAWGQFELTLILETVDNPGTCSAPTPLIFDGGVAMVEGNTKYAPATLSEMCSAGGGQEWVYQFTNPVTQEFSAQISADFLYPVLLLRNAGCTGSDTSCQVGSTSGITSLTVPSLSPGTYVLAVDGYNAFESGPFSLTATLGSVSPAAVPPGDTCRSAVPLSFSGGTSGTATVNGNTTGYFNSSRSTCGGSGPDQVFSFVTTSPRSFSASVDAGSSFSPVIYLRSGSCVLSSTTDRCAVSSDGGVSSIPLYSIPAGSYFLFVDGNAWGEAGPYTLAAELR